MSKKQDSSPSKFWAWNGNKTNPTYFEVKEESGSYKEIVLDKNAMQNMGADRQKGYDRAIYSGSKDRYTIEEVYLKTSAGRPDFATDGSYQEISVSAFANLDTKEKSNYSKVVKISDDLPDEAGGDGTDYLLNIEEVSFEGDHVSLVIDSWGYQKKGKCSLILIGSQRVELQR